MNVLLTPCSDEAKCTPEGGCPLQEVCLRNLRPPAPYQWYSTFVHWRTDECVGFMPVQDWCDA